MSPRYWRRDSGSSRPGGSVWLALLGLIGSFFVGLFVLVPELEPAAAASDFETRARGAAAGPAAAPDEPEMQPGRAAIPALDSSSTAEAVQDSCRNAMVAALGNARIEFLTASAEIVPASRNVISVLAALAHTCPGQIVVDGHSDDLGPEIVNEQISLERALSVVAAFVEFGIDPQRLQARGFGSRRPLADNVTADGRARNRRIEMSLMEDLPAQEPGEEE